MAGMTTTTHREVAEPNENGEIKGYGAPWVCAAHGDEGHDYLACRACFANFQRHCATWEAA